MGFVTELSTNVLEEYSHFSYFLHKQTNVLCWEFWPTAMNPEALLVILISGEEMGTTQDSLIKFTGY